MPVKKEAQLPLSCSCGSTKFIETGVASKGPTNWMCKGCGTKDTSKFTYADMPQSKYRDIEEILKDRLAEENRVFDAERFNDDLAVTFKHNDPIALVVFGDPHLDDKGTSLTRIIEDLNYVKDNDNTFGVCVGDLTNNWVGRLMALYGEQNVTIPESWTMVEWFCEYIPWLAMVLGNHDKWNNGSELLKRMTKGRLVQSDECAFKLKFQNGSEFSVNARHKWKGTSQWNPAHGVSKYAQMGGDYDLILGGHTHVSAYCQVLNHEQTKVSHCLQLASYKIHDTFAKTEGFRAHNIAPSMCVVVDPRAERPEDKIQVVYRVEAGIMMKDALTEKYRKMDAAKKPVKTPAKKTVKKAVRRTASKTTAVTNAAPRKRGRPSKNP